LSTQCEAVITQFSSMAAPPQRGSEPPSNTIQGNLPACHQDDPKHRHPTRSHAPTTAPAFRPPAHCSPPCGHVQWYSSPERQLTSTLEPPMMRRSLCSFPSASLSKCLCGRNPAPAHAASTAAAHASRCDRRRRSGGSKGLVRGLGVYARAGNQHKHTQWSTLPGDPAARTMPRAAKLLTSAWLPQGIAPKMVRANSAQG